MVTVVKTRREWNGYNCTHYIGRAWAGFNCSPFHNPYHVGLDGNRNEVILKFADYWYASEQKRLRERALFILGPTSILGCWCKPLACHGDIIAGYVNWKGEQQICLSE